MTKLKLSVPQAAALMALVQNGPQHPGWANDKTSAALVRRGYAEGDFKRGRFVYAVTPAGRAAYKVHVAPARTTPKAPRTIRTYLAASRRRAA